VLTILVSGSGTGVGKTRVTGALARVAARAGRSVQIVKPVQTGIASGEPSDAELAATFAGLPVQCACTLRRYSAPLAPLAAAVAEHAPLEIKKVLQEIALLPPAEVRLIEGAGGIAVPLAANGWDWVDFAQAVRADAVVLVVPDQLGAISQCRAYFYYLKMKLGSPLPGGVLLNEVTDASPDVKASIRSALAANAIPLWSELAFDALDPVLHPPLAQWLGI
jgi:dethiobiotin synthase